jgi:hypothetical protein
VRGPEPLYGLRVVAAPTAIDAALHAGVVPPDAAVIRIAPDDVFLIGVSEFVVNDPHAIVEAEGAFVGWWLSAAEVTEHLARHIEWSLPLPEIDDAKLAQGLVAGVPMKLLYRDDEVLVVVSRGLAHEAHDRLFAR